MLRFVGITLRADKTAGQPLGSAEMLRGLRNFLSKGSLFGWLVGCLTSKHHVSQGRMCSYNLTCCHTETEVANRTCHLSQLQHTDTGPTSPGPDPVTPDAWQCNHQTTKGYVTSMTGQGQSPKVTTRPPKVKSLV